jgi:septum site-determining protein MinC
MIKKYMSEIELELRSLDQPELKDQSKADSISLVKSELKNESSATLAKDLSGNLPEILPGISPESPPEPLPEIPINFQVRLKTMAGKLNLFLPAEPKPKVPDPELDPDLDLNLDLDLDADSDLLPNSDWTDLLCQLEQRLSSGDRFWQPDTSVYLQASDRLLDSNQLEDLKAGLSNYGLQLVSVNTQRRQTAIAAVTAGFSVDQQGVAADLASQRSQPQIQDEPLYLKMTVRSGTEIKHSGTVVIWGDVNAGGEVIADGDILVWGKLRGKAHAGAGGNNAARIMALNLEPTQIRIADHIARVDSSTKATGAEIAYISDQNICIVTVS